MSDTAVTFRAGAGMILRRPAGKILLCERKDIKGCWSLPQGGIEPGEAPIQAAYRELKEELGIEGEGLDRPLCIGIYPNWLSYTIPGSYGKAGKVGIGQTILWHVFEWLGKGDPPKLGEEFSHLAWYTPSEVYNLTVSPFKVQMYRDLMKWIQDIRV